MNEQADGGSNTAAFEQLFGGRDAWGTAGPAPTAPPPALSEGLPPAPSFPQAYPLAPMPPGAIPLGLFGAPAPTPAWWTRPAFVLGGLAALGVIGYTAYRFWWSDAD